MTKPPKFGFDDISARLLTVVPEITEQYEEELRFYGREAFGQHIAFSDVFNPYLVSLLTSAGNSDKLARAFGLVEELAAHDDVRVRQVAGDTVFETLLSDGLLNVAWQYMGEASRRLAFKKVTSHPDLEDETMNFNEEEYEQRWSDEIEKLEGMKNLTLPAREIIRNRIFREFGVKRYPRATKGDPS